MPSPMTGPTTPGLHLLYIPAVCALIAFQGYYSQYLFNTDPALAPGPLTRRQTITFNVLLLCLWVTYYRACTTDPGRYLFPRPSSPPPPQQPPPADSTTSSFSPDRDHADPDHRDATEPAANKPIKPTRWCKKCAAPKPLRAHHCRHCARCIPRMDHHCPWTGTCVSLQTFPHFLRFLVYTNLSLWYLGYLLWQRAAGIWAERHLPAYLGPSAGSLVGMTVLALADLATSVALGIMLYTTVKGWLWNCTMIEEWEVERHEAVLARMAGDDDDDEYSDDGGYGGEGRRRKGGNNGRFWGDDDAALRARLERIEFPYDLGVFANMAQAMGTRNPLRWFLPVLGGAPVVSNQTPGKGTGWEWEENGFNDLPGLWPPPDPEKMRQARRGGWPGAAARQEQQQAAYYGDYQTPEQVKEAFARRQEEDLRRRQRAHVQQASQQSGIIAELEEVEELPDNDEYEWVGKPVWTNSDGDRLWDYGVDEEVEEDTIPARADDDDVPLAELVRRRKVLTREEDS